MSEIETTEAEPLGSVPDPISGSDDQKVRGMVRELNKKREEQGTLAHDEIKTWDGQAIPETGPHQSPHSAAARAASYMRNMREGEVEESLKTRDGFVNALRENPDAVWNASLEGRTEDELARELVEGRTPPGIVNPVVDGRVLKPLLDHVKPLQLDDKELFANVADSARALREFREATERAQQAIVENIDAQIEEQAIDAIPVAAPIEEEAQVSQPQPVQQPQQPNIEQERAALRAQQQALVELHSRSIEERERIHEAVQIRQWFDVNYPPQVRTQEGFAELERRNPAHAQYLRQWAPAAARRASEINNQLQAADTIRSAQAIQTQKAVRQQNEQWAKAEQAKFMEQLKKDYPEIQVGTAAYGELNAATAEVLNSDPDLKANYNNYGNARSASGLRLITDRAMLRLKQAKEAKAKSSLASKRAPVHQPQPPGVYRPAGSAAFEDVRSLEKQLGEARSDREALRLATRLVQARRSAGM